MTLRQFFRRITRPEWIISALIMIGLLIVYFWENRNLEPVYHIYCKLDDYIPFVEWLGFPYVYWFILIPTSAFQLLWHYTDSDECRRDFHKYAFALFGGWAICLLIFYLFPSCIDFRPTTFERQNIATYCMSIGYAADNPINVLPSLHAFGAMTAAFGLCNSSVIKNKRHPLAWKIYYIFFGVTITVATVMIKQHSIIDVFASILLSAFVCALAYGVKWDKIFARKRAEG